MKLFIYLCLLLASFILLFGSCTREDHRLQPANLACQLNEIVEKYQVTDGSEPQEMIEIEGRKIPITTTYNSGITYKYDQEGRVIEKHWNRFTYYYKYLPNNDINWTAVPDPDLPYAVSTTGTLTLDSNGLNSHSANRFDSEGFRIYYKQNDWFLTSTITNSNITKTVKDDIGSVETTEYEYDLTELNKIPNPEPYFGKISRNKLLQQKYRIMTSKGSGYYILTEYKYVYDQNGQVKYRIGLNNKYHFDKNYNIDYSTKSDTYYTLTTYSITCQ